MEHWISEYGNAAVLTGWLLDGETILILSGFAAHEASAAMHNGVVGRSPFIDGA